MQRIRFRVILPVIFCFVSFLLFAWEYENDRVIDSVGMGWDTGPPVWPYVAVALFSYALNAPAYIVSWPILKLLDLKTGWLQYLIWLPVIIALWWWVGTCIDFGFLSRRSYSHRKLTAGILFLASVVLVIVATRAGFDEYSWVREHWRGHPPVYAFLFLRTIGPMLWCLCFAGAFFRIAVRLAWFESAPSAFNPSGYRTFLFSAALLCLYATGIGYVDRILSPPVDPNSCQSDRLQRLGCVHGTVADESEKPAANVEVNLIATFKSGDARRFGTKSTWTDQQGRYNFNGVDPGEYILAVNPFETSTGPTTESPFATRYFRHGDSESGAEGVKVVQPIATNLPLFKVRSAKFTTIETIVEWKDGSRPTRSDIFFQNTLYRGLLCGFQEIENGVGKIRLAQGFEYVANAQVDCIGRYGPERRLASPSNRFKIAEGQALRLVLIGTPCVPRDP